LSLTAPDIAIRKNVRKPSSAARATCESCRSTGAAALVVASRSSL